MTNKTPTASRSAQRGYKVDIECPFCGLADTQHHRIWTCTEPTLSELRLSSFSQEVINTAISDLEGIRFSRASWPLAPVDFPPHRADYEVLSCPAEQIIDGHTTFAFSSACGYVYTDGSAVEYPGPMARAAGAAVQLQDGIPVAKALVNVPPEFL